VSVRAHPVWKSEAYWRPIPMATLARTGIASELPTNGLSTWRRMSVKTPAGKALARGSMVRSSKNWFSAEWSERSSARVSGVRAARCVPQCRFQAWCLARRRLVAKELAEPEGEPLPPLAFRAYRRWTDCPAICQSVWPRVSHCIGLSTVCFHDSARSAAVALVGAALQRWRQPVSLAGRW